MSGVQLSTYAQSGSNGVQPSVSALSYGTEVVQPCTSAQRSRKREKGHSKWKKSSKDVR